jgi:hypothetical protein
LNGSGWRVLAPDPQRGKLLEGLERRRMWDSVRRVVLVAVAIALSVLACSRTDPGISREKAEAILRAFDFTDIELQPSPEGWSGTAVPASGGYRIRATVDRQGVMQLQP